MPHLVARRSSLAPPLKIAFFGTPQFSVPILNSINQQFSVELVVSQPDKPVGHGLKTTPTPVSRYAQDHHLPLFTPTSLKSPSSLLASTTQNQSLQSPVSSLPPVDLVVVAAYGHILPQWLLDWPSLGCINVHTSLLPKYRGASPINAALLNGDTYTGITFIKMNHLMDQGHIISQHKVVIDDKETADSLYVKMSQSASEYINQVLVDYSNSTTRLTPQDNSQATYVRQISKQDGCLDLQHLPDNWQRHIYAYHSWPGAWTLFRNKRVKLLPHGMVQMEGKKPALLADFLNGYPDFPLKQPW